MLKMSRSPSLSKSPTAMRCTGTAFSVACCWLQFRNGPAPAIVCKAQWKPCVVINTRSRVEKQGMGISTYQGVLVVQPHPLFAPICGRFQFAQHPSATRDPYGGKTVHVNRTCIAGHFHTFHSGALRHYKTSARLATHTGCDSSSGCFHHQPNSAFRRGCWVPGVLR